MPLYAIKLTDEEWLSGIKVGVRTSTLSWERTSRKALRFQHHSIADSVCALANSFRTRLPGRPPMVVVEVDR